mgnify:CR=1 FL=1
MSKDPLGYDPLGIDPVAQVIKIQESKTDRSLQAFRHGILLRGTHMVDPNQVVPPPVGDDGQELTHERRMEIAAQRKPYQANPDFDGDNGYGHDLPDHQVEQLGATAQKIVESKPEMTVVIPKELPDPLNPIQDNP